MNSVARTAWAALCGVLGLVVALADTRAEPPLAPHFRITDSGQPRDFELATDELVQPGNRLKPSKLPTELSLPELCALAEDFECFTGGECRLVLYERGVPRNDFTRRILTRSVLTRLEAGVDPQRLARESGALSQRSVPRRTDWWFFQAQGPAGALALAEGLRRLPGVLQAEPQLARLRQKKFVPNDSLFAQQWHLLNVGQNGGTPGVDVNVVGVWDSLRGSGVTIGIVDDGLQANHPDLAANVSVALSLNVNSNAFDPFYDTHGTPVAGLVAAEGNNGLGVCGVAFEAALADIRLLGEATTDEQDRLAMLHRNDAIQIKNNSWGASDGYGTLEGPGPLMTEALAHGTATGRGGRGEIYLFAGGNGRDDGEDVNYDGYANSINVIAVGAVSDQGAQASYSEPGACLTVVGPSRGGGICAGRPGLTTTDLVGRDGSNPGGNCEPAAWDYTATFGGTSAATPAVAGMVALMLQANPNLGWRDVKEILLRSATRLSAADPEWRTNAAGIAHHHGLGAGLVNAAAAVALSTNWSNLRPVRALSLQTNLNLSVPDNDSGGVNLAFVVTNAGFRVEHAALTVTLPHARFGDLAITLISPSGIASRLAEAHTSSGIGYDGWTLTSVRHWGEQAAGVWTVQVVDQLPGETGSLNALRVELYGSEPQAVLAVARSGDLLECPLRVAAPGWHYGLQTSPDLLEWSEVASARVANNGWAFFTVTNTSDTRRFYRARLLP